MPCQGFIQAQTDLHLPEIKSQSLIEFWNSILSTKKLKSNKNCLDYLEREPYLIFFTFRSHQWCKKSIQKEKRDLKKKKIRSPNDAWKEYLKTWDHWNSQRFQRLSLAALYIAQYLMNQRQPDNQIWSGVR